MKKAKILIVIALLIAFSTTVYAKDTTFSDIKDHWAEREIINLANQDIISGYPDGTFKPDANISRSEFSTLMYRVINLKEEVSEENTVVFQEIEGLWSEKFIEALVEKEVIIPDEYENGYLANEEITRVEIAKMVIRAIGKDRRARNISINTKFDDDEDIKKEDKGYIYLAEYYGIISGYPDNTFRPNGLATRAEAVKMLINQQKAIKKKNKPSSKNYADAKVQISLPQYTHTDKKVKIEATTENVKELIWKLEKQDENGEMIEVKLETPLSTTGGVINFPDKGTYKLTAQATNYGNRKFEFSESIKVYPIPKVTFDLGAYAHTDSKINVITIIEELGEIDIVWSLEKEGQDIALAENLSNDGGTITLKEKGNYTLTAAITDEVGRVFEYKDSIEIYPIITAKFDLPENSHTDSNVKVVTALQELGSNNIVWTLAKDGEAVDLNTYIEGGLDNRGGSIGFKDKGNYTLKATITDEIGRVFEYKDSIEVYPIIEVNFDLPENAHTDSNINVVTALQGLGSNNIIWTLEREGQTVDLARCLQGTLDNNGGSIRFKDKGNYTLKAIVTDGTGRVFEFEDSIEVYPIITVDFELAETTHTDSNVKVVTILKESGSNNIVWTLEKEGKAVDLATYLEGSLDNNGGTVRFKDKGKYTLKVTVTDEIGRTFEFGDSIEVYPIITASFDLPENTHTDSNVNVVTDLQELGSNNIIWSLEKDDQAVDIKTYLEGSLDNNGGIVKFKEKGNYTLRATVTDEIGRIFEFKDSIEVYPVITAKCELPENAHTDSNVNIVTDLQELGSNSIVWSLEKDDQAADLKTYLEGILNTNGGTVEFKEKGNYTLKATVMDEIGRAFEFKDNIEVYPVITANFGIPENVHTDSSVNVVTALQELGSNNIVWTLEREGVTVELETYIEGNLDNNGGTVRFKEKGKYTLKATVTDEIGRVFESEDSIEVHPIITASFELPETAHTDNNVDVATSLQELGSNNIEWSLEKEGQLVDLNKYLEGNPDNNGGSIRFKDKGKYTLKATVIDEIGRTFEFKDSIEVYPVITAKFDLPENVHTDSSVNVVTVLQELGSNNIVWTLEKEGKAVDISTYLEGSLDNNGGTVRFKNKGKYTLKAAVTDEIGRTFESEDNIEVYPVITAKFDLPENVHTDSKVNVVTALQELGSNNIVWTLEKEGKAVDLTTYLEGSLDNNGGTVRFKDKGKYTLKAAVTDEIGRVFESEDNIEVYPIITASFDLPETGHTDSNVNVVTALNELASNNIVWTLQKDGDAVDISTYLEGTLDNNGGTIRFKGKGKYILKATVTDGIGRTFVFEDTIEIYPIPKISISIPDSLHIGSEFNLITSPTNLGALKVVWSLSKDSQSVSLSSYLTGTLTNNGGNISFNHIGNYTLVGTITDGTNRVFTYSDSVTVTNNPPSTPSITANVTREISNGKFKVNLNVDSTDPDGDTVTYEYVGKTADNYYPVGSHTVKVRSKDSYGLYSEWASVNFNMINNPPTAPVITRTPKGNSIPPNTNVTITASSNDPDGDDITYVWEGRVAETGKYPLGKNVVKVKAVDEAGAESPQSAIVFFVADSQNGGGMTLTGRDSTIIEQGIEGASIVKYTFTVPPVSGHSGSDHGRIKGYNPVTDSWEQIDIEYTRNGVTMSGTLEKGKYTKLEFYYYTNHNCMYNKSNITYSVEYHFE